MVSANRLRSIGWATMLVIAFALLGGLTFKVNAVKSEVRQSERRIIALQQEQMMLETEFETRANQQQLANWNDVEFGYLAPDAAQFLEGERQLAQLGTPRAPGAPTPIEVVSAMGDDGEAGFPQMVSPLSGKAFAADTTGDERRSTVRADNFADHLSGGAAQISLSAHTGVTAGVAAGFAE